MGELGRSLAAGFGGLSRGAYNLSQGWGKRHDFSKSLEGVFDNGIDYNKILQSSDPETAMKMAEMYSKNSYYSQGLPDKQARQENMDVINQQLKLKELRTRELDSLYKRKGLSPEQIQIEEKRINDDYDLANTNVLLQSRATPSASTRIPSVGTVPTPLSPLQPLRERTGTPGDPNTGIYTPSKIGNGVGAGITQDQGYTDWFMKKIQELGSSINPNELLKTVQGLSSPVNAPKKQLKRKPIKVTL